MVKGVIFDMDGLMFDTERLWDTLWEPACAALGLPLPADMEKFRAGGRGLAGDNLRRHVARAQLARAEASANAARLAARRSSELVKSRVISVQDDENAQAAWKQAEADVLAARASLDAANVTLGYARITAPISGQIGKSSVTQGALVSVGSGNRESVASARWGATTTGATLSFTRPPVATLVRKHPERPATGHTVRAPHRHRPRGG